MISDAMPWLNPPLTLFHGTTRLGHDGILAGRVEERFFRAATDFGRGFYTTTSEAQARQWAAQVALQRNAPPAVLAFDVERNLLAPLEALWFVQAGPPNGDYWSFVQACRGGLAGHARSPEAPLSYDIVIGPVARNWFRQLVTIPASDQVSFHTPKALDLLRAPRSVFVG